MLSNKDIVVVVPIYLPTPSSMEMAAFKQCLAVLSGYDIVLAMPESLDASVYEKVYPKVKKITFEDECFKSLRAYNKLVLKESFYAQFASYKYMLIYQLDAYVFQDELLLWANKGYDYIGAPWLPADRRDLKWTGWLRFRFGRFLNSIMNRRVSHLEKYLFYRVGNGGLSLRKIDKMLEVTHAYKSRIDELLEDDAPFYPEDVLLLLEPKGKYTLSRPSYKEAMKFAVEHNPWWAYKHNHYRLPFGCHNWYNEEALTFWSQFINLN